MRPAFRAPKLLFIVAGLVVGSVAFAKGPSIIRVSEIQPGMRGYGLTVFRGDTPERFDVEVIDVLRNFRPDQDLILVKTPHPVLNEAIAVAGMSGSPIYLNDRLAGAYAYGWSFGTEPVVGVTPIESMLAEIDRPYRPDSFPGARPLPRARVSRSRREPASAARALGRRLGAHGHDAPASGPSAESTLASREPAPGEEAYWGARSDALEPLRSLGRRLGLLDERGAALPAPQIRPAATPLMLGGFTDRAARRFGEDLEAFGLVAMQAGGGGRRGKATSGARYVDGGAIGIRLIGGDINATAIGTVTHVQGKRLVAFGHPMMNAGEVGLPAVTARVLHIFRSQSRSFKLAEAQEPLGTLIHDRQSAIVIDTTLKAPTVPMTIRLHGVSGAARTEWKVELAENRALTPMLALTALSNAIEASAADQTDIVYRVVSRVAIEGYGPVEVEDEGYMLNGPGDGRALARLRLFDLLQVAFANPFQRSRATEITVDLHLRYANDVLHIAEAAVPYEEVDPGARVPLRVTLRRYGQRDEVRVIPVQIPPEAAGEELELKIQPADEAPPDEPNPRSLADLVSNVRNAYPASSLAITLKMPSRGLRFRGHVVRTLPPSALDSLQLTGDTAADRPFVTYDRQLVPLQRVVQGSVALRIQVREAVR